LAASPDAGVEEDGNLIGLLECKTAVKWSDKLVKDCLHDSSYPLISGKVNGKDTISLKPNHHWYHQVQLQLFVCRHFARYCDLAIQHPGTRDFFCTRFTLDSTWVHLYSPKFEEFFNKYMAPKLISKY
jgi:hypothetical protein